MRRLVLLLVWLDARTGGDESCGDSLDGKTLVGTWCERKLTHRGPHAGFHRNSHTGRRRAVIWS